MKQIVGHDSPRDANLRKSTEKCNILKWCVGYATFGAFKSLYFNNVLLCILKKTINLFQFNLIQFND